MSCLQYRYIVNSLCRADHVVSEDRAGPLRTSDSQVFRVFKTGYAYSCKNSRNEFFAREAKSADFFSAPTVYSLLESRAAVSAKTKWLHMAS